MRFSLGILIVVFCLAPVAVLACGGGEEEAPLEEAPFRIGVMESLTGSGETYGTVANRSKQMAADEINAAGGISGRQLELVVEDSQCRRRRRRYPRTRS